MPNMPARLSQVVSDTQLNSQHKENEIELAKIIMSEQEDTIEEDSIEDLTPDIEPIEKSPIRKTRNMKEKLTVGDHALPVRGSSGYRIMCSFLSEYGKFEEIKKMIQTTDVSNKEQSTFLINSMLISMDVIEREIRKRPDWEKHCEYKLDQIKSRASRGNRRAISALDNTIRIKDGKWIGNIREMICSSIGSSSPKAKNRNVNKFVRAGLAVIQFPRRPKKNQPFSVALISSSDLEKVTRAFETVYGGFKLSPASNDQK